MRDGFAIARAATGAAEVQALTRALDASIAAGRGGTRKLLSLPAILELASAPRIRALVDAVLGSGAFPVCAILFDKTPNANWKVPWHQDLMIPVRERVETPGYTSWSVKEGIPHVQPPARVLERMLAVRIHLDDCGPDNGPLRVIPGSHARGKLTDAEIDRIVAEQSGVACCVSAGDAVLMRPLTLHASSIAASPEHRRVIHIDYAACALDGGLDWPVTASSAPAPRT